mgnify:CR=1 FL=1
MKPVKLPRHNENFDMEEIDTYRTEKDSKQDFRLTLTQRGIRHNDVRDNKAHLY